MECAAIDDAELEYEVQGHGEPVLLIAPAAFSDGLPHHSLASRHLRGNTSSFTIVGAHVAWRR